MTTKAIGYVRVSRVGGRGGDSFLSPDLQRQSIERLCQREKLELVDVLEELDKSGGDAARPLWNQAIGMVERGEVGAIVCWNLDRFSRSLPDALSAIQRIEQAGGRLFSEEGAAGKLERTILLAVAEDYRDKVRDSFQRVGASTIERGIHFASRVPTGYSKDPTTRRLVPNEMAPLIVGLFERRSKGWGWTRLARWFVEQGGSPRTNAQAVKWMVNNTAYLGWAAWSGHVNRSAHSAIVSQLLYDRANAVSGRPPKHDGSLSSQLLLRGLVRCGSCGHHMAVSSSTATEGGVKRKVASYRCANSNCAASASVRGIDLDPFVVRTLFRMLRVVGTTGFRAPGAGPAEIARARESLEAAEYDRRKLVENRELRRLLTTEEYNRELVVIAENVEEARIALEMADADRAAPEVENVERLWEEWTDETRREWLREMVEGVEVASARRRRGVPLPERVRMSFRGLDEPILASTEDDIAEMRRRRSKLARRHSAGPEERDSRA